MADTENEKEWQIFSHNVAWLRSHHGLSKMKMAELLGIGVGSLNKIEKGILPPQLSAWVIVEINRNFHIRPNDLLTQRFGEDDKQEPS